MSYYESLSDEAILALIRLADRYAPNRSKIAWGYLRWDADGENCQCYICGGTFSITDDSIQEHGMKHLKEHGLLVLL